MTTLGHSARTEKLLQAPTVPVPVPVPAARRVPGPASAAWLDDQYNNRARVPQFSTHLAQWAKVSAQTRAKLPCVLDVAYGPGVGETLDVFPAQLARGVKRRPPRLAAAPVLVFIHGGYWRSLDKADHSFVAEPFAAPVQSDATPAACVFVVNYALCPQTAGVAVTVADICWQMARALAWVWRNAARFGGDPDRINVVGHSAGGHLSAMLLAARWQDASLMSPAGGVGGASRVDLPPDLVKNALSISGLYDLRPIRRTPMLQQSLVLNAADARRASPALFAAPQQGQLACVVGGDESPEFLRHNTLMRAAWGRARVPVCETLPGLNHFSVLEDLVRPGTRVHELTSAMLRR